MTMEECIIDMIAGHWDAASTWKQRMTSTTKKAGIRSWHSAFDFRDADDVKNHHSSGYGRGVGHPLPRLGSSCRRWRSPWHLFAHHEKGSKFVDYNVARSDVNNSLLFSQELECYPTKNPSNPGVERRIVVTQMSTS